MSDAPKLIPFIVAATFDNGGLCVTAVIATAPEIATGIATREFVRSVPDDAMLNGICAVPMNPDFLRAALRAVEGDGPRGEVVSLVPPEQRASLGGMGSRDDEPPAA